MVLLLVSENKMTKVDLEDILDKIEWEGFDYYFGEYASESDFIGTDIEDYVLDYKNARDALISILRTLCEDLGLDDSF